MKNRFYRIVIGSFLIVFVTRWVWGILIRVINPLPKTQIIRPKKLQYFFDGEVPVWVEQDRMNLECPQEYPEATLVAFIGDSIFFGTEIEASDSFTYLMQRKLNSEYGKGAWCILNLSQPAYSFEQQMYWYRQLITRYQPKVVFWELWPQASSRYRLVGKYIYNIQHLKVDAHGIPVPLPGTKLLHPWLLSRSRLFEYAFLVLASPDDNSNHWITDEYVSKLKEIKGELESLGAYLQLVSATNLDIPFDKMGDRSWDMKTVIEESILPDHFEILFLRELLVQESAKCEEVRLDTCCHFNEGHQIFSDNFLKQ